MQSMILEISLDIIYPSRHASDYENELVEGEIGILKRRLCK